MPTNPWMVKTYEISNLLITNALLSTLVDDFWRDIMSELDENQYVSILAILDYGKNPKTLGKTNTVKFSDKEELISTLISILRLKADQYHTQTVTSVTFRYKLSSTQLTNSIIHKVRNPENFKLTTSSLFGYDLPSTMNFILWGQIKSQNGNHYVIEFTRDGVTYEYHIKVVNNKSYIVYILFNNRELLTFTDTSVNGFDDFKRTLNNYTYFYQNSKLACISSVEKVQFIEPLKKAESEKFKLFTLDIETRMIGRNMVPYCICFFTRDKDYNEVSYSYYLSDYNSVDEMLTHCMLELFTNENNGAKIYIHNLSKFDSVFIIRILALLKINKGWKDNMNLKILKRDSNIIGIRVKHRYLDPETNTYKTLDFEFRDSYLTLPFSLKSLGEVYGGDFRKGLFPYEFMGSDVDLNYIGRVPEFKYFSDIPQEVYNKYANRFKDNKWSLRDETIKYCIHDCRVLHQVLDTFNLDMFDKYSVTIENFPTLPSLAFGIFRTNTLKPNTVPKLVGKVHDFIKKSYTGGAVDVYQVRPIPEGTIIKEYDVTSLYPTQMYHFDMPVGTPIYFELKDPNFNIDTIKNDGRAFGFFNVEVTAPDNLDQPILQTRVMTKEGYRTIAPLGQWETSIFSEEMYLAEEKFGYKFKILSGYLFDRANIFQTYVGKMFEQKYMSERGSPDYVTAKLLLNSLYGRFGMHYEQEDHKIMSMRSLDKFIHNPKYEVGLPIDLDPKNVLVSILDTGKFQNMGDKYLRKQDANISIGIASAISSLGRTFMSIVKNNKNFTLYYSDTDSAFVDKELPPQMVGEVLGQFKLENTYKDIVFLAPKVWAGLTTEGKLIVKIKGLSQKVAQSEVTFDKLLTLLNKDSELVFNQMKSHRNFSEGSISVLEQTYKLIPTENKRQLIYDSNNKLIGTKPFVINKNKEIINLPPTVEKKDKVYVKPHHLTKP